MPFVIREVLLPRFVLEAEPKIGVLVSRGVWREVDLGIESLAELIAVGLLDCEAVFAHGVLAHFDTVVIRRFFSVERN